MVKLSLLFLRDTVLGVLGVALKGEIHDLEIALARELINMGRAVLHNVEVAVDTVVEKLDDKLEVLEKNLETEAPVVAPEAPQAEIPAKTAAPAKGKK